MIADFDAHSWTTHGRATSTNDDIGESETTLYYVSVGPRFVVPANRVVVFGLAAVEYQTSRFSAFSSVGPAQPGEPGTTPGELVTTTYPARSAKAWGLGVGGGADITVTRRLAVRVVQINCSLVGLGEGPWRTLRLKSGLVLKF